MLRLDPAHPAVWRSADSLQFGVDGVVVITRPERWQQRLIHELEHGIPDDAYDAVAAMAGASPLQGRGLLRLLRPAMATERAPRALVKVQTPEGYPVEMRDAVAGAIEDAGWTAQCTTWFGAVDETPQGDGPVVIVADHFIEPRRAAPLVARDRTHLPLVFTAGRAEIGPLIVPGSTPCLACIAAHRCDADPAWPHIAAQLIGRSAPAIDRATAVEAGIAAARMLSGGERPVAHSLILHDDSLRRTWRAHRPHEDCRCRSLARSGTPDARAGLHREPTTARAYARPA